VYICRSPEEGNPKKKVPVTEKEGHINPRKEIRLQLQNLRFWAGMLFKKALISNQS